MTKDEFSALSVKEIKALLEEPFVFDVLLWAEEDHRSSVRKLADAYVMRQKQAQGTAAHGSHVCL